MDSILSSTYKNLEIILIDDGSTDNSGNICDEYRDKDNRIVVIHQKNSGVSISRNKGLEMAKGEYIAFVDSDDIISPVMYENMLWAIEATGADLAACENTQFIGNLYIKGMVRKEQLLTVNGYCDCVSVFTNKPSCRKFTWTNSFVTNKIYHRKYIGKSFEEKAAPAEDTLFNCEYVNNDSKMVLIPKSLYFWRQNENSITHTITIEKLVRQSIVWSNLCTMTEKLNDGLYAHLLGAASYRAHNTMWRIVREIKEKEYSDYMKYAEGVVVKYFRELINHEDTELKVKIPAFLFKYCRPLWRIAAKLHHK